MAQAATAEATMIAPCERFRTPETPKISVKPVAPSAYRAPIAKPSIRICQNSMRRAESVQRSLRRQLHELRELHLPGGEVLGPGVDLLAVLPLQHQPGDVARAGAKAVHVWVTLGQEGHAADGAHVVGL